MDLDRQWRIRDRLAGILAVAYGRHGADAREHGVLIDTDGTGRVVLRRATVGHEAAPARDDGGPRVIQPVDHDDDAKLTQTVTRFADMHMALMARDACLRSLDIGYDRVPAWSVVADSLLVHVASRSGGDIDDLCRLTISNGNPIVDDAGFVLDAVDQFLVRDGKKVYRTTMLPGWLSGGVIGHPYKIRSGSDGAATCDGKRRPTITLMDQHLPDTLLSAAAGHRLDEVLSHPVLTGSDAVISTVRNVDGNVPKVAIRLRRRRSPLASPPAGVHVAWLTTIAELST